MKLRSKIAEDRNYRIKSSKIWRNKGLKPTNTESSGSYSRIKHNLIWIKVLNV